MYLVSFPAFRLLRIFMRFSWSRAGGATGMPTLDTTPVHGFERKSLVFFEEIVAARARGRPGRLSARIASAI
jgi:hypothetical protein